MTDLPFVDFGFKATGSTTDRTMPARLAEIKNVMDFGAYNDDSHATETTAAIQTAVDWTSGANRGTIYFPLGNYRINAPITFNYDGDLSIFFRGEIGTTIAGSVDGYFFDRHLASPNNTTGGRIFENIAMQNSHPTGGGIRLGSTDGAIIRNCNISAQTCFTAEDAVGQSSTNINFESCAFAQPGTGNPANSRFIIIGGAGTIKACQLSGAGTAVTAYGSGLCISGCRSENCNTSFQFGFDSAGNDVGASGFALIASTCEGCWTAYDFAGTCSGFALIGVGHFAHPATDANSGVSPSNIQNGQYTVRIRAGADGGLIQGLSASGNHDQACISIANASSRQNLLFREVSATQSGGSGTNWNLPTNAYTARFVNCNVNPIWTYSQLPSGGNVLEGDEFDISDCQTGNCSDAACNWGANVTGGGGSLHRRVRYNNTNWTVVGK